MWFYGYKLPSGFIVSFNGHIRINSLTFLLDQISDNMLAGFPQRPDIKESMPDSEFFMVP